jgi:hypothetical protein
MAEAERNALAERARPSFQERTSMHRAAIAIDEFFQLRLES